VEGRGGSKRGISPPGRSPPGRPRGRWASVTNPPGGPAAQRPSARARARSARTPRSAPRCSTTASTRPPAWPTARRTSPRRSGYLPGAAPPVGLAAPPEPLSLEGLFAFSSAAAPPAEPPADPAEPPPELSLPAASSPPAPGAASPLADADDSSLAPVAVPVLLVAEVDVEGFWAAAFSALVSVGGMMSGVLF